MAGRSVFVSTHWKLISFVGRIPQRLATSKWGITSDSFLQAPRRHIASKKRLPFEVNTAVEKDVLVYSHANDRFYKLLTYFGCAQFAFWAYLGLFSFQTLRDEPEEQLDTTEQSWWRKVASKESKYKNGISVLCFCFGYLVLCISIMYPARAVKQLWLLKGGSTVQLDTFSALGRYKTVIVPMDSVSCLQARVDASAQIPMKVKGKWFFFLLDKRGRFHSTDLFDYAVGLTRSVK
ncbi:hypothetical protein BaRGS_00004500 [Batillaria attramentaria]|uniref:Transmembrane protein 223 n=1 Tax=Batillaria attramentaria TaxID=370345 RepID=A0ABD0LYI3_9CAEN